MKFTRKASAEWKGTGKDGKGTLSTHSGVLKETPYSFRTRFEDAPGTNPEELIGVAHAGCFTMQISFLISEAGFTPTSLQTNATVTFEDGSITMVHLNLVADVPGLDEMQFHELALKAKQICPVSKLLNAQIELSDQLTHEEDIPTGC